MKVLIITEGGRGIGFGHLTRCIALSEAFKLKGIQPLFIVNGDHTLAALLKKQKAIIFNWLQGKDRLLALCKDAEIIIVDSYLADRNLLEKINALAGVSVYIDDNRRLTYPPGIVVNGTIYAQRLNYPKKREVVYLLGAGYMLLRREFWQAGQKMIKKKITEIMLTFGGEDPKDMTSKVLELLVEKYPGLDKNVIVGSGFKNKEELRALKDKSTRLIYEPNAKLIKRIMLRSDIAISAGGQTLHELARIGVPTIAITVADNQANNINEWKRIGFLGTGLFYNEKDLIHKVAAAIGRLDYLRRSRINRVGRRLVDGRGSLRIREEILKYA